MPSGSPAWLPDFEEWIERAASWSGPVLLIGGSPRVREGLARLLHGQGPTRGGWFRLVDAAYGAPPGWLRVLCHPDALVSGGTLFVDSVDCLCREDQLQLLAWLDERVSADRFVRTPWRIIAGLEGLPGRGRILPALLDSLDKWRVDLR
ncbi:MAG TPA: hypothetical protein VMS93_05240 [Candidatus Saccharimonadales bacterium]|nr:hypothetical protein [Candidatus Saccharimonadales bacterium]